jgi:DNA-binding PadR family transcriptional regulator
VPRKYYRLTQAGQTELVRLTHEWNTFASAMARLLRQQPERT